ncbi:hypothetical protein P5673_014585 [Acropora cervicornis]|uniref:Uncharacterized protein n=1 Tax=Acropora cervicornis TaxID=6130 RepID=A0AAD9QJA8_ACRCE|nr:hypothetical protein P5673_014585 [Acropora cervicornis]
MPLPQQNLKKAEPATVFCYKLGNKFLYLWSYAKCSARTLLDIKINSLPAGLPSNEGSFCGTPLSFDWREFYPMRNQLVTGNLLPWASKLTHPLQYSIGEYSGTLFHLQAYT